MTFRASPLMLCGMGKLKRTHDHITQRQFAELAGVSVSTVNAWKKAGHLDSTLSEKGLIMQSKARAWVMRNVKHAKKEAKA